MRKLLPIGTAAMLIATVTACGQRPPAEWTLAPQKLESPAGATSSEPQLSVSSKGVLLSWIERVGTTTILKFAERTASGWTQPMTAASGEKWFLSYADVPSVQRMTNGTLIAQYLPSTNELLEAYDLVKLAPLMRQVERHLVGVFEVGEFPQDAVVDLNRLLLEELGFG